MKNTIIILFIFSLFAVSCNDEEYLDKKPHSPTDVNFYTSEDGAVQGINAAYDVLQKGEELESRLELNGTVCSGDAVVGGEPTGQDQPALQAIGRFNNSPTNPYLPLYWNSVYRGIYRCNLVIKYMSEPIDGFNDLLRNRLLGEAYFLRALFHFKLQINFGGFPQLQGNFNNGLKGIPYVDHVLLKEEWNPERPTLEETWTKIENDFAKAAEFLPVAHDAINVGRATKGAAKAMLAKSYLYQEKWQQAYDTAKDVITSGPYYLIGEDGHPTTFEVTRMSKDVEFKATFPAYKWIWSPEANNCSESIFDVQHMQDHVTNFDSQEGNILASYYGPRRVFAYGFNRTTKQYEIQSTENFWGFILPTNYFVETAYKNIGCVEGGKILDPRFKLSVITAEDKVPFYYGLQKLRDQYPDSVLVDVHYSPYTTGYVTWKYFTDPYYDQQRAHLGDRPQNTKYFRFADLLLIGAEAAVHIGNNGDALTWINRVRNRARNSGNTGFPKSLTAVTLDDIYAERRVELAFEGHQFFDVVRTLRAKKVFIDEAMVYQTNTHIISGAGDPVETIEQFGDAFEIGKDELCPIPQTEIDNTGGAITQNPGW